MATTTTTETVYTDDFTGEASGDVTSARFSLNGTEYEIDLNVENLRTLEAHLQQFIDHGRKVGKSKKGKAAAPARQAREDTVRIRAWAKEHYDGVNDRGRISAEIVTAYHASQAA